ncbi:Xaa-Pro peptidase family protein [Sulfitobacter sp. F26204]|uniref:M24 family metallopeptidase n=1 Tax=Sulfitobacter sp. F26204 TaxID=2996014 RepID=UPI00225E48C3|nr:Xaa-Pro peptidase family protein [Sulfitobacter sp. F26204]MCX7561450.1 Xaa-Pro peptidase family protein [Sulfitobacter sp. F26204]
MSRLDFTPEEFANRRAMAGEAMRAAGIEWLIVINPRSIHWLTGCRAKSYQAFQCLFFSSKGAPPVYLARVSEKLEIEAEALADGFHYWGDTDKPDPGAVFGDLFAKLGLTGKSVAIERPNAYLGAPMYEALARASGSPMADASALLDGLRLIKSEAEITFIRKAAQIATVSMGRLQEVLSVGQSELALTGGIYQAATTAGGEVPASPINLSAGARGLFCHGAPGARAVEQGDIGNAEYAIPYRGYPVSIGRQFCLGPVSTELADAHACVAQALQAAIATCAPGVPACEVFTAAEEALVRSGFAPHRVHTMGYAMATAFPPATGEAFHISSANSAELKSGMQISICPNLFSTDLNMGVRLVDNVMITDSGAEVLTKYPHDVIQGRL